MSTPHEGIVFNQYLQIPDEPGRISIHGRLSSMMDAEELSRFFVENPYLQEFQPFTRELKGIEGARLDIQKALIHMGENESMQYRIIAAPFAEPGPIIGTATLYGHNPRTKISTAKAGIYLDSKHQGQGVAARATEAVIGYAKDVWNLHFLELEIAEGNIASEGLAQKLGAVLDTMSTPSSVISGDHTHTLRTWRVEL